MDVIRRLRKITGIRKIGHAGTLDPFATGLLICAIGQYTRLLQYAEAMHKSYEATVTFGQDSTTGDPEGELSEFFAADILPSQLSDLPQKVLSLNELPVPIYSAIKIAGKRAYEYARAGQLLEMPIRPMQVFDFCILNSELPHNLSYRITVSKGTYIRAFSEWLALQLGTKGYTTMLRRTAIGNLQVTDAYSLDNLEAWQDKTIPVSNILNHLPTYTLSPSEEKLVFNGGAIAHTNADFLTSLSELEFIAPRYLTQDQQSVGAMDFSDTQRVISKFGATEIALYTSSGVLMAIGEVSSDKIQPKIVLNQE